MPHDSEKEDTPASPHGAAIKLLQSHSLTTRVQREVECMILTDEQRKELRGLLERMEKATPRGDLDAYHEVNLRFHDALVEFAAVPLPPRKAALQGRAGQGAGARHRGE